MHHIESNCPVCGVDTSGWLPCGFYHHRERVVIYPCDACFELVLDEKWQAEYVKTRPVFRRTMIIKAIKEFLEYGEKMVTDHRGDYFAGAGFAVSVLRYHLADLEEQEANGG